MLIDGRKVVALPERVKLSPEREQNALRHQACSTARPCLADRPARRWRWLHPLMASGLVGGRNQHRCNRRACADAAGCDQRDGDQGTHPTAAVPTVPKERNAVQGSLLLACSRPPAARPWASTPRGSVMGLIANDRQRRLGVAAAAGSLRITTYNSDWQISGKRRLAALGHATGRVLYPA